MTDFTKLKDILEMSELLNLEFENQLEVLTYDRNSDKAVNVIFIHNEDGELIEICAEIE